MLNEFLHNPQIEGEPFYWEGGSIGVLLSHGFTATPAEVRLLAERLRDQGYTVAGPLLPGHGTTPTDLNRIHWLDWVQTYRQTYQKLAAHCQKVFVGGESAGAVLGLHLASEQPEIAGLLLYSPAIKLAMTTIDQIKLVLAAPFLAETRRASLDVADKWQGYPGIPLKGALQLLRLIDATRPLLPRVQQPVLVIQGRFDTTIHPTAGAVVLQEVSSSVKELHWLEKSTHVVLIDQELDQITRFTLDFMHKVLKPSG